MHRKANPNWIPSGKNDYLPLLGDECHWYRIIIDEAQCIKNKNTKAAIGASLLKAKTRFCMTGTPMMVRRARTHPFLLICVEYDHLLWRTKFFS